jgi:hypothetical protein
MFFCRDPWSPTIRSTSMHFSPATTAAMAAAPTAPEADGGAAPVVPAVAGTGSHPVPEAPGPGAGAPGLEEVSATLPE